jgi:drug/metabolite transporter (DMT)-like permease
VTPPVLRGIAAMLAAAGFFAGMDAFLKLFSVHYPPLQVSAMRGAASVPFVLLPLLVSGRLREIRPVRWQIHLLRGVLAIAMLSTFIYSLRTLPLADAYAVFLAAPLLVTALSGPMLGERVDAKRWAAIVGGMVGVLVLLRPSGSGLTMLGALAAFAAALCYAFAAISVRVLTRTDTTASMVFWFMILLTVCAGALALPTWVPFRAEHWPWLLGVGILGALGQHFITEAFRLAPASTVAPFEYTALVYAIGIDWFVWRHAPNTLMFVGGGIIVACGLYLVHRERQTRRLGIETFARATQ